MTSLRERLQSQAIFCKALKKSPQRNDPINTGSILSQSALCDTEENPTRREGAEK